VPGLCPVCSSVGAPARAPARRHGADTSTGADW
jgi:hypothetical protein